MPSLTSACDLIDLLARRADADADLAVYTVLAETGAGAAAIDCATLFERARAVAARLQQAGARGERAIVPCPSTLDAIVGFWAVVCAGAIPVPVVRARPQHQHRLDGIVRACAPRFIVAPGGATNGDADERPWAASLVHVDPSQVPDEEATAWVRPSLRATDVAFLQYTSGSTGSPKGVAVSHANLLVNASRLEDVFELDERTRCVSWLPLYHDMGLIGGMLQSVYTGYATVYMSPAAFVERPVRWLQAVSAHRATVSGGPNFGYELTARALESAAPADLDLRAWRVAFCGAEPVREDTLRRFVRACEPYGFSASALRPCYGLAEATLLVSAGRWTPGTPHVRDAGDPATSPGLGARVSLGPPASGLHVAIVDPSGARVGHGERGEIWITGSGVAQGYWNDDEATAATFHARLADGTPDRYLRTGDVGALRGGELLVLDRLKDVIIIRGVNYYAHDLESTIEACHPAIRTHACAAIAVVADNEEQLVVLAEVDRGVRPEQVHDIRSRVQQTLASEFQLTARAVLLLSRGAIPRTSSGKIQRGRCREAYVANAFRPLAPVVETTLDPAALAEAPGDADVVTTLRRIIAAALHVKTADVPVDRTIGWLGLDSLRVFQVKLAIERVTGVKLAYSALLAMTLDDLASVAASAPSHRHATVAAGAAIEIGDAPLSPGQQALWYMQTLRPDDNAYTIARALRIRGALDPCALEAAFRGLEDRHHALRLTVGLRDGEPRQQFTGGLSYQAHDASAWDDARIDGELRRLVRAPFDLERGPVMTVDLFTRSADESLLFVRAHHLAVDLWSLALLFDELEGRYRAARTKTPTALEPPRTSYAEFARWQNDLVRSAEGERLADEWRCRLEGHLDALTLPTTRAIADRGVGAGHHAFEIPAAATGRLAELSRAHGVTLNVLVIAAFEILLARYSGQRRFLIGTLASGRTRSAFSDVVGYCVNLLPLRATIRWDARFDAFLQQTSEEVRTALDRQELPFSVIVERLRPHREADRLPLVRAVCVCQPATVVSNRDLRALVLNHAGAPMPFDDLLVDAVATEDVAAQFDLSLVATHGADGMSGRLQYDAAQFDADDMRGMADALRTLLTAIADRSDAPLRNLPLVDGHAYRRESARHNATDRPIDTVACVHELIEQQAAVRPAATALMWRSKSWTYADLSRRVDACARRLARHGVGPEIRVAVCIERSMELVAALVGVLRAGGAYVPLDPQYPLERIERICHASQPCALVTSRTLAPRFAGLGLSVLPIDELCEPLERGDDDGDAARRSIVDPDNAMYVMHTSGSTGMPKGVVVSHRNVLNLFAGMDDAVGCGPADTMLAVTSVAFDISVVELLWTLARGARVVVADDMRSVRPARRAARDVAFSLFYFADSDSAGASGKYDVLLEGARSADRHGFAAIWTPERHFHPFGGLYPNPSVTSAALATITTRVRLRAGSVVLPLHHPIRVAEEWSVVDNLSGGRVDVAFASGWHAEDFAFCPADYAARRDIMFDRIETVRRLWRGETVAAETGDGRPYGLRLFPRPIQSELPIWLTAAGSVDTFRSAGRIAANVLTHLLGQDVGALASKIAVYAQALAEQQRDRAAQTVTLMLHAYVDDTHDQVVRTALAPFKEYLRSSLDLVGRLVKALSLDVDLDTMAPKDLDDLIEFAAHRYMGTSGLFGTPRECLEMLERLSEIGVDEVACLIDFGIAPAATLANIERLARVRDAFNATSDTADYSIAAQAARTGATLLQCTPSMMALLLQSQPIRQPLSSMRAVLLGGEPLPPGLLADLDRPGVCMNVYGPTETTVWSAASRVPCGTDRITIGGPLANTQLHVLDAWTHPLPDGVAGEVWIGGAGVARGYWRDPAQTASRFVPDAFSSQPGARLYRTGDIGRRLADGSIELLGRADQQVKIRGYRVELGDVEAALNGVAGVRAAVAVAHDDPQRGRELIAYVVPDDRARFDAETMRAAAHARLPPYMIPTIIAVDALPTTANHKVDRQRLARMAPPVASRPAHPLTPPRTDLETTVQRIWQDVLGPRDLSVDDNFFEVGGHSLLIAQVHDRLQRAVGVTFPLVRLLERPTIRQIAEFLDRHDETVSDDVDRRAADQRRAWEALQAAAATRGPVSASPAS
jgi:natural product biosynthesis luciferase-like monooxygenase protein